MNKKAQENNFIGIIIAVIVSLIFLAVVAGMVASSQRTVAVINDSATLVNGSAFRLSNLDIVPNSETVTNASDGVDIGSANYTMNYPLAEITLTNNASAKNVLASYDYRPVGFIGVGLTRTVIGFVTVFMGVAIIAALALRKKE